MDLMGMMGKLKETQQKWKKQKTSGYSSRWWTKYRRFIKSTITANRTIKSVTIADDLLQDKELEDYMI
jgi:DNA-binding protein YbaB